LSQGVTVQYSRSREKKINASNDRVEINGNWHGQLALRKVKTLGKSSHLQIPSDNHRDQKRRSTKTISLLSLKRALPMTRNRPAERKKAARLPVQASGKKKNSLKRTRRKRGFLGVLDWRIPFGLVGLHTQNLTGTKETSL